MKQYKPYKNNCLNNYDYHTGWFFVTNKTNNIEYILTGKPYSIVQQKLINLTSNTKGVSVDYLMIMSNHIHVILIFKNSIMTLSEFWRRFKAITTLTLKREGVISQSLWQKNFFEHIIRNVKSAKKNKRVYAKKSI